MSIIDDSIDMSKYHLFKNGKSILMEPTLSKLKKSIKENIKPPTKNTKVYVVNFFVQANAKYPLKIFCVQFTITPTNALVAKDDDIGQTIFYSNDELLKYKFKKNHIQKIIKAIKNDLISYEKSYVSITDVINAIK